MTLLDQIDKSKLPKHVAIIMDGNGRWAQRHGLKRAHGHREGSKAVRAVVTAARKMGISVLTLYAFSSENWSRPLSEIRTLMSLLKEFLIQEKKTLLENNIRLKIIGNSKKLPKLILREIFKVEKETQHKDGMILNIALSYGGREEIIQATQKILKTGNTKINEKTFSQYLYTEGLPDPDLLIRSSGEMRISNFLLWQCAYSEFYFTDTLWPDFREEEFYKALHAFQLRERRYGRVH